MAATAVWIAMQSRLQRAIGHVEIGVAIDDEKDRVELVPRPPQRPAGALRLRLNRNAESGPAYHAPFVTVDELFAEMPSKKQDFVEPLPRDIVDQQIQKHAIIADLHKRFRRRVRQILQPRAFAANQQHGLTRPRRRQGPGEKPEEGASGVIGGRIAI